MRCGRVHGIGKTPGWTWRITSQDAVWLWLNVSGDGLLWGAHDRFFLRPGMYALTGGGAKGEWACLRHVGDHRLEVIQFSRQWLVDRLGRIAPDLPLGLAGWLESDATVAFCGLMGIWEKELCGALETAAKFSGAPRLIAEARLLEWAANRLVTNRTPRAETGTRRSPVQLAIQILRSRLDQPLNLPSLSRQVGISPHHLSRQVSAETGTTLLRHLRRMRVEHACEALATGRMNVTEVALETGYQSLSHFAKAFREEMGRTPSDWLAQRKRT